MKVVVYTKPDCPQCEWTKKILDKQGTPYEAIDASESTVLQDMLRDIVGAGPLTMPIVVVSTDSGSRSDHWAGLKLEKLKGLKDTGGY